MDIKQVEKLASAWSNKAFSHGMLITNGKSTTEEREAALQEELIAGRKFIDALYDYKASK